MRIVVGGTFEFLHVGHRELLRRAFELGDEVLIGITSDSFKPGISRGFEERKKAVEEFVSQFGKPYRIVEINDMYGPTLEEEFDAIVVSRETRENAERINEERIKRGLKRMEIVEIPIIVAEDLLPVSSRRIREGEIDEEGRRIKRMLVRVGSENPSKIRAVKMVFERIFNFEMEFQGVAVDSGVPPQPVGEDTVRGAKNRAVKALGEADYSVGLEAGLFWEGEMGEYVDRAYCAILDKFGRMTFGHSGGFIYPPEVIRMVKSGLEVGEAMERISGIEEIKKKMGAIGYLSKGIINRDEFNAQAVLMAMIPRIRPELYLKEK